MGRLHLGRLSSKNFGPSSETDSPPPNNSVEVSTAERDTPDGKRKNTVRVMAENKSKRKKREENDKEDGENGEEPCSENHGKGKEKERNSEEGEEEMTKRNRKERVVEKKKRYYRDPIKATYHEAEDVWEVKGKKGIVVIMKKKMPTLPLAPYWAGIHFPDPTEPIKLKFGNKYYSVNYSVTYSEKGKQEKNRYIISGDGWTEFVLDSNLVFNDCLLCTKVSPNVLSLEVFRVSDHKPLNVDAFGNLIEN